MVPRETKTTLVTHIHTLHLSVIPGVKASASVLMRDLPVRLIREQLFIPTPNMGSMGLKHVAW
jgi:hypothetical protein